MSGEILIDVVGDSGPFSRMGKSIGYRVVVGGRQYLIDCGAPVFQRIGDKGFGQVKGVFVTHAHDDHKRWLTDMALYKYYEAHSEGELPLITTETVHAQLEEASRAALCRSLSLDSKREIDLPYESMIRKIFIGPRPRYRIELLVEEGPDRVYRPRVVDDNGRPVDPSRAKVVIHPVTRSARMLWRDSGTGSWVEPEVFYSFGAREFYHEEQRVYTDESGLRVEAVKSPVWHGLSGVGLLLSTGAASVFFTSDTVHDRDLWRSLAHEVLRPSPALSPAEFEKAAFFHGDINDYLERSWSRERYERALECFEGQVVVHDVAGRNSVVHTDYAQIEKTGLSRDKVLLTHSPDIMASEWVLCKVDKQYIVSGSSFFEMCRERLYPLAADLYFKHYSDFFIGLRSEDGEYWVYRKRGLLGVSRGPDDTLGEFLFRVDLYQDIAGDYYPRPLGENEEYVLNPEGRVELVTSTPTGSIGRVVEGVREELLRRRGLASRPAGDLSWAAVDGGREPSLY